MASNIPLCGPCERENEHHQASSWCSTCGEGLCKNCSKEHKKNRASSKHTVVLLGSMSRLSETMILQWNRCEAHSEKEISLFCRNHDQLCCTLCIPGFHRRCDDVICIVDASKHCRRGFALSDLQTRIKNLSHIYESILKKKNDNIIALENEPVLIGQHIPENNVTAYLKKNKKLREDFSVKRDILTQKIIEESDEILKKKTRLDSFYMDLQTLGKEDSEADQQLFVAVKRFDIALHKLEQDTQEGHLTKMYSILQARPTTDISSILATPQIMDHNMADIPELSKLIQCQSLSIGSGNLKLIKTIDLKNLVDFDSPWVWKVCVFPSFKKVALSDTKQKCIYIYDCERGTIDTMRFGDNFEPYYITTFDTNHALVAAVNGQLLKINILDLSVDEDIKICSETQFPMLCVGDYLLICENQHIIIVTKHGLIIRKIHLDDAVGYMCSYGDNRFIYTSFYSHIECMTLEGNSLFKVTRSDLNNHFRDKSRYEPMGVSVDKNNFIYVVLFEKHILRLTPEGKIDKFVLDLEFPGYGMAYNSATDELVLIHNWDTFEFYKIE
ncbi:uncharacterized protein LOC134686154 [Mytilus trossulus]|uniref:uncharacterized protein LOC134686154 n=1 Tax=Mytilus trossulus TaxID=6551 RepID=UPI003006538A